MDYQQWTTTTTVNQYTGKSRTRHLRKFTADSDRARVYAEVYELGGRFYWSANIHIPYRPDLSRLAYGTYAAVPGALAVAKMRASRLARHALRAQAHPKGFTRAA